MIKYLIGIIIFSDGKMVGEMKKKTNRSNIKRRLIALLTIAVFVFVMGFCPVNIVSATDTEEPESIESNEVIQQEEASEEDGSAEAVDDTADVDGSYEDDWGYIDIPEVREMLAVKKGEEPAYLKKEERKLENTLEDVYDSREMPYYKNRVAMFDQRPTGTCWAHSFALAAQISYLKELYSNSSLGNENYRLAPLDFAYNFYNRVPYEKYGFTDEDKNIPSEGNDWTNIGGNNIMSSLALFGWMGMHAIENASFKDSNAYNNSLVLQNAKWISDNIKEDVQVENDYHDDFYVLNQTLVKQAIKDYGAVSAEINMKDAYYNAKDDTRTWNGKRFNSYNCDYTAEYYEAIHGEINKIGSKNHAITLIGWDDEFPKEYFTKQPQNDGAWIMQNSKGTGNGPGKGFWYVSYEDLSLSGAAVLDMQPADTYDANYQYDGNAMPATFSPTIGTQVANVFTVPDEENGQSVEAVGFAAFDKYLTKYRVSVYKGVSTEPTTGTLAATIDVQIEGPGCYTFDLTENGASPVYVEAGEKFSVVVEATETSDSDNRMYFGYERASRGNELNNSVIFTSTGLVNTSFYRGADESTWSDVYKTNESGSFRIKAFATNLNVKESWISLPKSNYNYTGKKIKPEPIVKYNGQELNKDTDYTVSYSKNKYPGIGKVTVEGKGLYSGSASKTFKIAGVNNFRQTAATKKTVTLKWKKSPKVTGYKIYKLKKGKFKRIKTIKKNSKIKFTDKKLKAGTKYRYKIRTYKKVGKKTYNGPLSDVLVVRTKGVGQ